MQILENYKNKEWFWALVAILFGFALAYPMFGTYFLHPNEHMFAFGGDALTLYYNVKYHTCYGSGDHLTSMNYPKGELIFLTDAQGALSVLLSFINKNLFNVCDYTLGITHSLMMFSYLISCLFLYKIFEALGIKNWRASVFAGFVAIMSPQILRIVSHHGLSYSFIIPMAILWLIRKHKIQIIEKRDLLVLLVLMFFGFNNPYLGFATCLFVITVSFVYYFYNKNISKALYVLFLGILPLVIIFSYFKINDSFEDRIKLQWGYFEYKSTIEGLFATPSGLVDQLLILLFGKGLESKFESNAYLGFPIVAILIGLLITIILKQYKKYNFKIDEVVKIFLISSSLVFLYTSAIIFLPLNKEFVEEKLGVMLMFKAVARLSWPLWYSLVIIALVFLEQYLGKLSRSGYIYTLVLVLSLWYIDYVFYTKPKFKEISYGNLLSNSEIENFGKKLQDAGIKKSDYQAILLLPRVMTWTDQFLGEPNFFNHYIGVRTSLALELPMISCMLSRMSIGETAEKIEFISNPIIKKSLQESFPNRKNILVIWGKSDKILTEGEDYIIKNSDTLMADPDYIIYSFALNKINYSPITNQFLNKEFIDNSANDESLYYNGFDKEDVSEKYTGKASRKVNKGESLVAEFSISKPLDSIYIFSAWSRINYLKYGAPIWKIQAFNNSNQMVNEWSFNGQNTFDIHDNWQRSEIEIKMNNEFKTFKIFYFNNKMVHIDNLLFRPKNTNVVNYSLGTFNGFRVE